MIKVRALKTNFVLNAARVLSSALISVAMMPYINRILGVSSLGRVEYITGIINYFVLFSALGIPIYGIREIARVRDNAHHRTIVYLELTGILLLTTVASYTILFIFWFLGLLPGYGSLVIAMSGLIFLSNIGAEWYFQGIEDQLYITIRSVGVRILGAALIFIFVKGPEQEALYAWIMMFILGGANAFNLLYIWKTLNFNTVRFSQLNLKKHLKPVLTVFAAAVSINIYLHLDKLLLGSIKGPESVAYYTVANRIVRIVIELITVVGVVLLPRLSKMFQEDKAAYLQYILKAFYIIMMIAVPCSIYIFVFAPEIIEIMAGQKFQPAALTMRILSSLCIIVGIAYYVGYLILYTQHKEKIYTRSVMISALMSIALNFFVIKFFSYNGAAVVAVLSEIIAVILMILLMRGVEVANIWTRNSLKIVLVNFFMLIFAGIIAIFGINVESGTSVFVFAGLSLIFFMVYFTALLIAKEENTLQLARLVQPKIRRIGR